VAVWGSRGLVIALAALLLAAGVASAALPAVASATSQNGSDWQHALILELQLRRHPPKVPVVVLLGDSLARESTVDDSSWSEQTSRYGVGRVLTYNLGSRSQSFIQTMDLIRLLPSGRVLVFIAVDPGRFMSGPAHAVLTIDHASAALHLQHHYKAHVILSRARRMSMLREWQERAARLFPSRYVGNLTRLDAAIRLCRDRGFRVALVDMPMDFSVIGTAMDQVRSTYRHGCMSLASLYGIPFIDQTHKAGLVSSDFYDLAHMVGTGWAKWQTVMAKKASELLQRYGWRE
jgi:hypothetical protein